MSALVEGQTKWCNHNCEKATSQTTPSRHTTIAAKGDRLQRGLALVVAPKKRRPFGLSRLSPEFFSRSRHMGMAARCRAAAGRGAGKESLIVASSIHWASQDFRNRKTFSLLLRVRACMRE